MLNMWRKVHYNNNNDDDDDDNDHNDETTATFYGHYTGQPALAGTYSWKPENFVSLFTTLLKSIGDIRYWCWSQSSDTEI